MANNKFVLIMAREEFLVHKQITLAAVDNKHSPLMRQI